MVRASITFNSPSGPQLKDKLKEAVALKEKSRLQLEGLVQISLFHKNDDEELDELQGKAQACLDNMDATRIVQQVRQRHVNAKASLRRKT